MLKKKENIKIFYDQTEINYDKPNNYAFLNWYFDDSTEKNNTVQIINDNFEMGKGYMSNAVLSLYSILHNNNPYGMADILIFPILFDIYHGVELWLKSSINSICIITAQNNTIKNNHDIFFYLKKLKEILNSLEMHNTEKIALSELSILIKELHCRNANFDFARYSFDKKGNKQFYNAPFGDKKQPQKNKDKERGIVPNTAIDLHILFIILLKLIKNFKDFIEYLTLVISDEYELSDEEYSKYLMNYKSLINFEEYIELAIQNKNNFETQKIMQLIHLYIL